ncbi:hypothetical protein AXF42_Ash009258 [Apostasia shenzhenica]|uniref:Uncharacterized protein n=1 Tax=Apostasia shenzhenica TaxID=1088818 RepID=A0A2I0B3K1_9ASPA|nr:hypothetical protein AXF42_Ash009258 [Apostasia shenzhenica]
MSTGKTKKDTRLQNLNTRPDEFRPLNQGSSPGSPPLLCQHPAGCSSEKRILQVLPGERITPSG